MVQSGTVIMFHIFHNNQMLGYGANDYWRTVAHWQFLFSVAVIFAVTILFSILPFMFISGYGYNETKRRDGWRIAVCGG